MAGPYSYDGKLLKGLGVGPFLKEVKTREKAIAQAEAKEPAAEYRANRLAASLHPARQYARISDIQEHKGAKTYALVPDLERGTEAFAYFRAGQYVSVQLNMDGCLCWKPYTIQSSPKSALGAGSHYQITVKEVAGGKASDYILNHWKVGDPVVLSGPQGDFFYQGLRDARKVVALAGGSGITPFYAMAQAIADETEDFELTILYGSRSHDAILLDEELVKTAIRSGGRVKVVNVLSDDPIGGFEHGFLTAELIKRYAPEEEYSLFVCGPKAMYAFEREEIEKLGLPKRRVRFELSGEFGNPGAAEDYPREVIGRTFALRVLQRGSETVLSCRSSQSVLSALEEAGIAAPSHCRSGKCGVCRCRLVEGDVFVPAAEEARRQADRKFGWIHSCISYPLSDLTIEIFPPVV